MSENEQSLQPVFFSAKSVETQSWKAAYEKTRWELDTEKLLTLIHATEAALLSRWQELEDVPAHREERHQMEAASRDLLAIKIHRLGWPDPCQ
jgi:hypothetical protein